MIQKIFGTDGVRGEANLWPITPDTILKIAIAAGFHFTKACKGQHAGHGRFTVVIGKDTRLSGYMVESCLVAGFVSMGIDVILLGPLPTPATAVLTRSLRADLGVMISASHNPYQDNGIKFFKADGHKISLEDEKNIEFYVAHQPPFASSDALGKATRLDDALGRYVEIVKSTFPRGKRLEGLRIVVDCAHGSAYKVAPRVLWELGADVIILGDKPQGNNINLECGAMHPQQMIQAVLEHQAHLGIALDGDADRVILSDEKGQLIDGDQVMAAIACQYQDKGILKGNAVVSTVMSNLGFERFLKTRGLKVYKSAVGDRNVSSMMLQMGCNVGGEQSGHIILNDYCTTGDGLIAALQILSLLQENPDQPASALLSCFTPVPQKTKNIRLLRPMDILSPEMEQAIDKAQESLGNSGQVLIRPSGTEPLLRLMAQGDDEALLADVLTELSETVGYLQQKISA